MEVVSPKNITGQAELAWQHIIGILGKAGMTVTDIVKVTQYLTRADDIADYAKVRTRYLGAARPASMLLALGGVNADGPCPLEADRMVSGDTSLPTAGW